MKIVLASSRAFYEQMEQIKAELVKHGFEVTASKDVPNDHTGNVMTKLFPILEEADAMLVLNYERHGIPGYIGVSVLIEMTYALWLGKKIYVLNELPDVDYREEIDLMGAEVIGEDLSGLTK